MPLNKRPAPGEDNDDFPTAPIKQQHLDSNDGGSSALPCSSRKKGLGSTRTGQACLRCRTRKIRCDNRPGGCSPCVRNNTECRTTDRITGRATSRGHTEHLENENAGLKRYLAELQDQIRAAGLEPKPAPAAAVSPVHHRPRTQSENKPWTAQKMSDSLVSKSQGSPEAASTVTALLPEFRAGCVGDNYLGVSFDNWLSSIQGTSLSLFGTKVDLAEFMPSEEQPLVSAMSYQTFLSYAFGRVPRPKAPALPSLHDCKVFADWYFRSIQTFIPMLHKPDHMQLLTRMSDARYQPTAAQIVMVHMVLALIFFQFFARNGGDVNRIAFVQHYHYAISFIPELLGRHEFEDLQALTLICSQLRSQPRPAAAWMFTNMIMGFAIESGLHRSAAAWNDEALDQNPHLQEMRKRVFWSLLMIHVQISGKLGRPMPLRIEDFDIEIPKAVHDSLPSESDLPTWKKCSFRVGIEGFKLCKIMMQIFSTVYTIKSACQYEESVRIFEKDLCAFEEQLPPELQGGDQSQHEDRVSAHYLGMEIVQCQLLLHHPALCPSQSRQLLAHNLDVSLEWGEKLLEHAVDLKHLKSLDTTWFFATDFLAAIFTTLFASHERKDQGTPESLQRLRTDMTRWTDVMGDVGHLLGSGPRLRQVVQSIIDTSLTALHRDLAARSASANGASSETRDDSPAVRRLPQYNDDGNYGTALVANEAITDSSHATPMQGYHGAPQCQQAQEHPQYHGNAQFRYPEDGAASYNTFDNSAYVANGIAKSDIEPQIASLQHPHQSPMPSNYMASYHSPSAIATGAAFQQSPQVNHDLKGQHYQHSFPAAWRHFTGSMMGSVMNTGQEYMDSVGPVVAQPTDNNSMNLAAAHVAAMNGMQTPHGDISTQPWPLIQFNAGPGDGQ